VGICRGFGEDVVATLVNISQPQQDGFRFVLCEHERGQEKAWTEHIANAGFALDWRTLCGQLGQVAVDRALRNLEFPRESRDDADTVTLAAAQEGGRNGTRLSPDATSPYEVALTGYVSRKRVGSKFGPPLPGLHYRSNGSEEWRAGDPLSRLAAGTSLGWLPLLDRKRWPLSRSPIHVTGR
jgi:hypothetical protein